ncbi:TPA-induced transmembrane protein [Brachyhypopomus gauderio]|uniref:TPA-induced transmembrane protein n=1 Tax=Brachyhypopomus gauderio TaxID=698409 RepID=UPI0040438716
MELQQLRPAGDYRAVGQNDTVTPENGTCSDHSTPRETENGSFLQDVQVDGGGRENCDENDSNSDDAELQQSGLRREFSRMKKELGKDVVCHLKLWMLIVAVLIIVVIVIVLSVSLCKVHHEDEDETYDRSTFMVPRFFSGNFNISNLTSMPEEEAIRLLERKVVDVYNSSFALTRYFSSAELTLLRRDMVEFQLQFLMPEEHGQLERYTLSREMVYSVLFQRLVEQDSTDPLYIYPLSLYMQVRK